MHDAWGNGIAIAGGHAYVVGGDGFKVIDTVNPQNPYIVATLWTGGTSGDIVLRENYAFVSGGGSGLAVIDVSTPAAPAIVGGVEASRRRESHSPEVSPLAALDGGIQVVDVGDPLHPRYVGGGATAAIAYDVVAVDGRLLVACDGPGLQVLPQDCGFGDDCSGHGIAGVCRSRPSLTGTTTGSSTTASRAGGRPRYWSRHPADWPSIPFTPIPPKSWDGSTFDLTRAGRVDVRVYDIAGRRVRTLVASASYPAGRGSASGTAAMTTNSP